MGLLNKAFEFISRTKFTNVPNLFISKDDLFRLTFDNNWIYSKKGNSFYSFQNLKDDLKGGLQFSFTWNVNPPELMKEEDALLHFINVNESEIIKTENTVICDLPAISYRKQYVDSNMIFSYWYIYHQKILIVITFMIFEDEPEDVRLRWLIRVTDIINSLKLNLENFHITRMR